MNPLKISLLLLALSTLGLHAGEKENKLRMEIQELAEACKPVPGTPSPMSAASGR